MPLLVVTGCGGPPEPEAPATDTRGPLTLTELMPLEDGTVSSFETENDLGEEGLFVLEVSRPRPERAELSIAGEVQRINIEPRGLSRVEGGYLLRLPLEEGASFEGPFGTVTLTRVNHSFEVPAGHFDRCVTTVEEATRPPKRATSVYCSSVGLVSLVVETFGDADVLRMEARLKSHGPRVDLDAWPEDEPDTAP